MAASPLTPDRADTVALLCRWHGGDHGALHVLVERYLPRVRQYVHRRLGDSLRRRADSGDVVQDAMLEFLRYSPRFQVENGRQFEALVLRIVDNVLRDQHDWYSRKRREIDRECSLPASSVLYLGSTSGSLRPSEAAQANEKQALVRLSLELLRAGDRQIIILREYDGLTYPEIASRLAINEAAVRMRLSRALRRLGQKMREMLGDDLE
ncbi:MAG: sigma-70 family RNA polymerase sigma factor [Phycisphaerales bacterium]|nr:sigma-70 family RNA polymerase sigma factor [Phycisphaerales bacterium]